MAIKENDEIIIPINSSDGRKYLLKLSDFKKENLTDELLALNPPQIVDIDLKLVANSDNGFKSSFGLLTQLSTIIFTFLEENNCILYFYCDDMNDIQRKDMSITPQAYRSMLFSKMFDRTTLRRENEYINIPIFIKALEDGNEREIYMHLIASHKHSNCLDLLKDTLNSFNKE